VPPNNSLPEVKGVPEVEETPLIQAGSREAEVKGQRAESDGGKNLFILLFVNLRKFHVFLFQLCHPITACQRWK